LRLPSFLRDFCFVFATTLENKHNHDDDDGSGSRRRRRIALPPKPASFQFLATHEAVSSCLFFSVYARAQEAKRENGIGKAREISEVRANATPADSL
jgi:hypothetical protein